MKLQTKTKKWIIGLAATGCAVTMGVTGCVIGLRNNSNAVTNNDTTSYVKVDELWNGTEFNGGNLNKLLQYVSGNSAASASNLTPVKSKTKTATSMRGNTVGEKTSGKDIIVTFGGLDWEVVYLSPDNTTNADPVLTLWLSNNTQSAWTGRSSTEGTLYGYLNGGLYSDWSGDWQSSTVGTYPSNMYGTSYIRAVTLNNGGQYATSNSALSAAATQNSNSAFAKFTMPSVEGSVTQFLNKPNTMSWQLNQTKNTSNSSYSYQNDSINNPTDANWYTSMDFTDKTGYSDWGNDYLWLPSLTETGYKTGYEGMWGTSIAQRQNYDGSTGSISTGVGNNNNQYGTISYTNSWLRSGNSSSSYGAFILYSSGTSDYYYGVNFSLAVRPAIHLNLRKAAEAAKFVWTDFADTSWEDETDGSTEATAYIIDTPEKLAGLAYMVNDGTNYNGKYFKQSENLDLSDYYWDAIGISSTKNFYGVYDGCGYSISGITLNPNYTPNAQGLFGYNYYAKLKNIHIKQSNMKANKQYLGSIVGFNGGGTGCIENCSSSAKLINTYGSGAYTGGIIGLISGHRNGEVILKDCLFSGIIKNTGTNGYAGGIVGCEDNHYNFKMESCYVSGAYISGHNVGGIIGYAYFAGSSQISNCIVEGSYLESTGPIGGIVGLAAATVKINNCFVSCDFDTIYSSFGAIVGYCNGYGATITNCAVMGTANIKDVNFYGVVSGGPTPTIDSSYIKINGLRYYSSGDFSDWALCGDMNDDLPMQKALYFVAQFGDSVDAAWFAGKGFEKV